MQFLVKNSNSYLKTLSLLALLTAVSVFGCTQLGYIFLPFASAFYAALLIYDKTPKKILSVILPIIFFIFNFLFRGLYSLEAVSYVVVGLIIYFAATKRISKGETAFFLTAALVVLIAVSSIFLAFEVTGQVAISSITEFYSDLYDKLKTQFVDMLTAIKTQNEQGLTVFAYNVYDAVSLFMDFIVLLIPVFILAAFLIAGLTLKFFAKTVKKISGEESGISTWRFSISNFIAYFYIAIAIISVLASADSSVFSIAVVSLNTVLAAPFAYLGFTFIYGVIRAHGKSSFFSASVIIILCIIFSSFSLSLLSFIGVYFNIISNKIISNNK